MATNEITGARYLAESLKHLGVTHVFFMDAVLRRSLVEMEQVGITRVLAHSEKAAAYMADAYARVTGRVGVCMAQSVGAANLAAGLQDAWLHRAPVLAITGRKPSFARDRNAYQEIDHAPLFEAVTKMHADVEVIDDLPRYLEQAFREATEGTPPARAPRYQRPRRPGDRERHFAGVNDAGCCLRRPSGPPPAPRP